MLAAVALDLFLFRLFRGSPRPVGASERTQGIIQHIVSNFIAVLLVYQRIFQQHVSALHSPVHAVFQCKCVETT